jgi:hypothetical protein
MQQQTLQNRFALVALTVLLSACTTTTAHQPLTIQEQGSFMVGGTAVTAPGTFDPIRQGTYTQTPDPAGQTLHGDHAYVFYQVPANARKLPLVFWHGHGQSGKTCARARANGVTQQELVEVITHLAFYTGWPNAVSAVGVAREVFHAEAQPGQ